MPVLATLLDLATATRRSGTHETNTLEQRDRAKKSFKQTAGVSIPDVSTVTRCSINTPPDEFQNSFLRRDGTA